MLCIRPEHPKRIAQTSGRWSSRSDWNPNRLERENGPSYGPRRNTNVQHHARTVYCCGRGVGRMRRNQPQPQPESVAIGDAIADPTPSPSPIELPAGDVPTGTYVARPFLTPNDGVSFTFTLPEGWSTGEEGPPGRALSGVAPTTGFEGPTGMSFGFLTVTGLEGDPCNWPAGPDVELGPTVEDLATALAAHDSYDTSNPTDVTLGGFSGKRIDVELPAGLDLASCDEGQFWIWTGDGQAIYAQGPEGRFHLWILDVEGRRVIVMTHDFPGTPASDQAELQSIVESIQITP